MLTLLYNKNEHPIPITQGIRTIDNKICTICQKPYPNIPEYFYPIKNRTSLDSRCRKCMQIRNKKWRLANPERAKNRSRKWKKENPEKIKIYRQEQKTKRCEAQNKKQIRSKKYAAFHTYATQLTIEEDPKDDGEGNLLVKCTYCGKYFKPVSASVKTRIKCLLGHRGECRLYCSQGCKDACPIYNQTKFPKGFKPATSREVNPLIRQMCLKRDNYTCQKCWKTIDEIELHAHHIEGVTQMPMLANDVENTVTLCKPCHIWVHQQNGCGYFDLKCV